MLYHYTTVQALALILSSKRMRFSRVDGVDDMHEAKSVTGIQFAKFLFISCWTTSSEEQIPLWHMYTPDMTGVRIGMGSMPFREVDLHPLPTMKFEGEQQARGILDFSELSTPSHCIMPLALSPHMFGGPVEYVADPEAEWTKHVTLKSHPGGTASLEMREMSRLPRFKAKHWEFQKEYRFVLMILPPIDGAPAFGTDSYAKEIANHSLRCLTQGIALGSTHFDLELSNASLSNLEITIGPKASDADRILLRSLLATHAPKAVLRDSSFTGAIRNSIRK